MASIEAETTKEILSELLEDRIRLLINKTSDNSSEITNLVQAWLSLQKLDYPLYQTIASTPTLYSSFKYTNPGYTSATIRTPNQQ